MNIFLRAAADRFIYDIAALRTVADLLEDAEFDAICPATGATVAATFGLLLHHYDGAVATISQPAAGASELPIAHVGPEEVDELLASAICDIVQALTAPSAAAAQPGVVDAVVSSSSIGANHALDFLEAVPELAQDSLLLNWAIFPVPGEPAGLHERRLALIKRAREARKNQ
ncbi:MAG: hypothetical protein R3B97_00145 [Dehalococcoidia bacterium]|nr:hypothetical protein [Dehalococcoidia bacterium]MCB9485370.1 hypothetical protein [Thermoflexaceae bacterium]